MYNTHANLTSMGIVHQRKTVLIWNFAYSSGIIMQDKSMDTSIFSRSLDSHSMLAVLHVESKYWGDTHTTF